MVPRLIDMWKPGQFPIDKLVKTYDFADINTAFDDSRSGAVAKPPTVTFLATPAFARARR